MTVEFKGIKQVTRESFSQTQDADKLGYFWLVRSNVSGDSYDGDVYFGTRHYGHFGGSSQYTLTFKVNGSEYASISGYYGETVPSIEAPTQSGYTFSGWVPNVPATFPAQNQTFNGYLTANQHTLTYVVDGQPYSSFTVAYGTEITPIPEPVREGYTFSGWDNVPATMPNNDVTISGTFSVNRCTLTFLVNGSGYTSVEGDYGTEVPSIAEPSQSGYTFSGWTPSVPATFPAQNQTFNGWLIANKYMLTYLVDGVEYSSSMKSFGEEITPISAPPSRIGYTFSGWDNVPATMPNNNVTVNGYFTINSHTLTYLVDGQLYSSFTLEYGESITPITVPDPRTGYTFSGWTYIPQTMPDNNVTVNGYFNVNRHTLTYLVDDQMFKMITGIAYDSVITPIAEPVRTGYTFSGWDEVPERMPDNDVTVNGYFTINQYTLTFMVDGNTYTSVTGDYGAQVPSIETPTAQTGYSFSGWTPSVPATFPSQNETFNGYIVINQHELSYYVDNSLYSSFTVSYGTTLTPIAEPTQEGYTFSGWDSIPQTMPDNNVRIDGYFSVNQYTLTFMVDGNTYTSVTGDYGTQVPSINTPSQEGYAFSGWTPSVPATFPAQNQTFNGYMKINSYIANYFIDNDAYTSITYNYGATIAYPDVPRSGYTLDWNEIYSTMPASNIRIDGHYIPDASGSSTTVYYGPVPTTARTAWTSVTGMNNFEYTGGDDAMSYVFPADPGYPAIEEAYDAGEITDEEFEEWMAEHNQSHFLAVPSNASIVYLKNATGVNVTATLIPTQTTTIDGVAYQCYVKNGQDSDVSVTLNYTIKIQVN